MNTDQDSQAITLAGRPDELAQVVLLLAQQLAEQQTRTVRARNVRLLPVPTATSPLSPAKRRALIAVGGTWTASSTGVAVWALATASLPTFAQLGAVAAAVFSLLALLALALRGGSNKVLVWGERVG